MKIYRSGGIYIPVNFDGETYTLCLYYGRTPTVRRAPAQSFSSSDGVEIPETDIWSALFVALDRKYFGDR